MPEEQDEKLIPKKEAIKMLGISVRTFSKIKKDALVLGIEPDILWDPDRKKMVALYSLRDVRVMIKLKESRGNAGWPKGKPRKEIPDV